jgi:uncharacterized protein (DUF58 family)
VTPTARTAVLAAGAAVVALFAPVPAAVIVLLAVLAAAAADARTVRSAPPVERRVPHILSRGVAAPLRIHVQADARVRQPALPDVRVEPQEADGTLEANITALRRGRHSLPAVCVRTAGPLGLGAWLHREATTPAEVLVYPDLVSARRIALAVRTGRFREAGRLTRGPLGLGTEFESIRDYTPDDDVRQVNWRATARTGRPMSNQYRIEQDRDVVCLIDCGRLMAAPLGDRTRLDAAVDAAAAVAYVADVVGDRVGVIAFDAEVRRHLRPRRAGGEGVVRAVFDLEPTGADSDFELAFRRVGAAKRAFVLVLTDLLDEAAARSLTEAVPVLARRHAVVVAGASDPDLRSMLTTPPRATHDVYAAAVALDVLDARERVARRLEGVGARVLEAPPDGLAAACVAAYLKAKARARL